MDDGEADEAPNGAAGRANASTVQASNAVLTDNDNEEATNCSETMSTANEEEELPNENQPAVVQRGTSPCRMATRTSVKNRPATPRRQPVITGDTNNNNNNSNCDASARQTIVQQCDSGLNQSSLPPVSNGVASDAVGLAQDDSATDTNTLSLASLSGLQAPPSYGTATASGPPVGFTCATLDASQLAHTVTSMAPVNRLYYTLNNHYATTQHQEAHNQVGPSGRTPLSVSAVGKTIASGPTMRPVAISSYAPQMGLPAQLYEQSRRFSLATTANNNAAGPMQSDLPAPFPPLAQAAGETSHLSLSYSRSLPRFQLAHLNVGQKAAGNMSQLEQSRQIQQLNLRLTTADKNHDAKLNARQEQPRLQMLASAVGPINHVISAKGSFQQQSANQYYTTGATLLGAPGAAEVVAAAAQQSLISSQSSEELARSDAVRIMDPVNPVEQQQPHLTSKMQPPSLGWPSSKSPSAAFNRNDIPRSISVLQRESASLLGAHQEPPSEHNAANLRRANAEYLEVPANAGTSKAPSLPTHRKRRRHKSTSGRGVSPQSEQKSRLTNNTRPIFDPTDNAGGKSKMAHRRSLSSLLSPTPINASQSLRRSTKHAATLRPKPAISAHCWLVDSSDDQTYSTSNTAKQHLSRKQKKPLANEASTTNPLKPLDSNQAKQQHLTVAIMRQTQRQQQQLSLNNDLPSPSNRHGASSTWSQCLNGSNQTYPETQASTYNRDMTTNLKTNSLKMERILSRGNPAAVLANYNDNSSAFKRTNSSKTVQRYQRHKPTSFSSSDTTSETGVHQTTPVPATTIMRLSSLLSFASNLVKLTPKCSSYRQSRYTSSNAPPNSVSGSVSATSASGQLAAYTNASLAISSSSSTSAYATGSSSAATNNATGSSGFAAQSSCLINIPNERHLIANSNFNQRTLKPSSTASTAGSSMFYSSSGTSGFQMMANNGNSLHGYEYCDTLPDRYITNETQFGAKQDISANNRSDRALFDPPLDETSTSSSSSSSSSMSLGTKDTQAGQLADLEARRLAQLVMSDHELISGGSDSANCAEARSGFAISALPAVVSGATSVARRRWWWISFKDWLRRPCNLRTTTCAPESGPGGEQISSSEQTADGARYKSLRSNSNRRTTDNRTEQMSKVYKTRSPSTLQNIISLAKADRVFRIRLVASLIVSIILLALIFLLVSLIYTRSTAFYQNSKSHLMIDDSDYDLSWLWPSLLAHSGHLLLPGSIGGDASQLRPVNGYLSSGPAYRVMDYLQPRSGPDQFLDGSLRSQLMLIERSEHLEQSQQTMMHLTNIQLANDYFIDVTQLPEHWNLGGSNPVHNTNRTNSTLNNSNGFSDTFNSSTTHRQQDTQLDHIHLDLVSLTLLSNLHWPLVKWRHQNQQSVANFLSFAMPSPSVSFGGTQTIRSLLSLLMLTESTTSTKISPTMQNLQQFIRLNSLLRSASKQLISCSMSIRTISLRAKFCNLLITRYKRMMITLSNLNHNHLAKLHSGFNQFDRSNQRLDEYTGDGRQFKWPSPSHTLFGFFLDRLALLDVHLLAESILSTYEEEIDHIVSLEPELDQAQLIDQFIFQNHDNIFAPEVKSESKWGSQSHLFEFAKSVIGEGPERLNINLGTEVNSHFKARFQQSESENNILWREQLNQDILFPWPSFKLPQFLDPINYDLFLHPNLTTYLVMGMAKIEFQINRPTRYIIVSSSKLNLVDLSLWSKIPADVANTVSRHEAEILDGSNFTSHNLPKSPTLKSVAIRRVLLNNKLQQIYIELEEDIEPFLENQKSSMEGEENEPKTDGINFGELPKLRIPNRRESHFVISISFNKTSLMMSKKMTETTGLNNSSGNNKESGLEFTSYGDYFAQTEGDIKTIFYTKFEPFNARKLFPSFDEPHLKAKFQLNLVHEHNHQVLFNAPKRERVPYTADGLLQMSVFESTPIPLSTYLVSLVVCDSQNIRSITSRVAQFQGGLTRNRSPFASTTDVRFASDAQIPPVKEPKHIQVQVLAQFESLSQAEFASQLVPQLLAFYQTHLQLGYPLEKLDLIAIPKQLQYLQSARKELLLLGAKSTTVELQVQQSDTMENLGLIWFRAPLLLVDTNLISQNLIEQISLIISHQLAHQYFGNIVSIRRWQDLWLYESLCQYLESIALSNVQADWKLDEQFVVPTIQETLAWEQFESGEQQYEELFTIDLLTSSSVTADEAAEALDTENDLQDSLAYLESSQDEPAEIEQQLAGSKLQQQQQQSGKWLSQLRPSELRKSSAVLHMLLFNLLPSNEARARLLRNCLAVYQYKTMSVRQFWRQFGEQLTQEGLLDRMPPNLSKIIAFSETPETETSIETGPLTGNFNESPDQDHSVQHSLIGSTERVVFVKPSLQSSRRSNQDERADVHRIRVRALSQASNRLTENLELLANSWTDRRGYPLISASIFRDRIHLKQERFSFTWWDRTPTDHEATLASQSGRNKRSTNSTSDVELDNVWTIPLMFVSRFNSKQPLFFWLNRHDMELPVDEYTLSHSARDSSDDTQNGHLSPGHSARKGGYVSSWFKLNVNQSSLVRINYDDRNWEALTELLMKSHYSNHVLNPLDRANLIDDALTLMRCGKLSVSIAMNLTLYLEVGERDFMPWTSALKHLDQMQTLLNQNPLWHRYVLKLMQPISSIIGWKDDGPHLMRKLRRNLFSVLLQYGDDKMVNKAKQEFKSWFKSNRFIVPNLQELVYVAGVRYGDQQEWFHCWQKYQHLVAIDQQENDSSGVNNTNNAYGSPPAPTSRDKIAQSNLLAGVVPLAIGAGESIDNEANAENEKRQLLTALASTHNTWLLEQFLNYSIDSTKIQPHHLKHVMQTLGKNPVARLYLWRFVRLNWLSLAETHIVNNHDESATEDRKRSIISNNHILETMIVEATKHFATKLDYEEVRTFASGKKKQNQYWSPAIERAVQQSLQLIKSNIYWRDHIEPKLTKWLSHYDNLLSK